MSTAEVQCALPKRISGATLRHSAFGSVAAVGRQAGQASIASSRQDGMAAVFSGAPAAEAHAPGKCAHWRLQIREVGLVQQATQAHITQLGCSSRSQQDVGRLDCKAGGGRAHVVWPAGQRRSCRPCCCLLLLLLPAACHALSMCTNPLAWMLRGREQQGAQGRGSTTQARPHSAPCARLPRCVFPADSPISSSLTS